MRLVTNYPDQLLGYINAIIAMIHNNNSDVSETFNLTNEGLHFRSMDTAHVCMMNILLPPRWFNEYSIDKEITISINLLWLRSVLGRAIAEKPNVTIESEEPYSQMIIKIENQYNKQFTYKLGDEVKSTVSKPKIELSSDIIMTSDLYKEIMDDIHTISDYFYIQTNEDGIIISGDLLSKFESERSTTISLSKNSEGIKKMHITKEAKATYSVEYLFAAKKLANLSETIRLEHGTNVPMKISIPYVEYWLAPRIDPKE